MNFFDTKSLIEEPVGNKRTDFSSRVNSIEPLDGEFRARLETYFSPEIIQKMTELIMMNQKIKEKQDSQYPLPSFGFDLNNEPRQPLPFFDQSITDSSKNAFVEAFKQKHRKPTPKTDYQTTTSESNPSILMHLYHRFG